MIWSHDPNPGRVTSGPHEEPDGEEGWGGRKEENELAKTGTCSSFSIEMRATGLWFKIRPLSQRLAIVRLKVGEKFPIIMILHSFG